MNVLETAQAVLAELENRYGADWEDGKWKNAQAWIDVQVDIDHWGALRLAVKAVNA